MPADVQKRSALPLSFLWISQRTGHRPKLSLDLPEGPRPAASSGKAAAVRCPPCGTYLNAQPFVARTRSVVPTTSIFKSRS